MRTQKVHLLPSPLRTAFLAFCNHSEARRLFVYLSSREEAGGEGGGITVSATPPRHLSDKALFFLKCSHASKLNRESIGHDVVYSECSTLPLGKLHVHTCVYYIYMYVYLHTCGVHFTQFPSHKSNNNIGYLHVRMLLELHAVTCTYS